MHLGSADNCRGFGDNNNRQSTIVCQVKFHRNYKHTHHIIQHDTQSGGNYVTHSGAQITKQLPVVVTRGPKVGRHSAGSRLAVTPRSPSRLSLFLPDFWRFRNVFWCLCSFFYVFRCENLVFLRSVGVLLTICVRWRFCGGFGFMICVFFFVWGILILFFILIVKIWCVYQWFCF